MTTKLEFLPKIKRSKANRSFCPKTATSAFHAYSPDGSLLGVVFAYEGITEQEKTDIYFCAKFAENRKVESSQPITLLGEVRGMTIAWINHDIASRVFVDEDAFLEELRLVGKAFFLEQNVRPIRAIENKDKK